MGFLYRLMAAALVSIAITVFTLVVLRQPVSPRAFYGSMALGVLLSYADDWRMLALQRRIMRRGF